MARLIQPNNFSLKSLLASIMVGVLVGTVLFEYLSFGQEFPLISTWKNSLYSGMVGGVLALVVSFASQRLNDWFPWRKGISMRLLMGILGTLTVFFVFIFLPFWLILALDSQVLIKLSIILLLVTLVYNVLYFAVYSYFQFSQTQVLYVENERKQLALQLEALRSQLSPHFLFNCLNTISSLLYKDLRKAEDFIRKLAKTYQYTLETKENPVIPLSKELEFVKAYQYLLSVRFEDLVNVEVDLSQEELKSQIPPMTIQLLVENAVKHNVISKEHKLRISISTSQRWLVVSNNKTKAPVKTTSFKIGLDNIKSRYQLLHKKEIMVEDADDFSIYLPLLT